MKTRLLLAGVLLRLCLPECLKGLNLCRGSAHPAIRHATLT